MPSGMHSGTYTSEYAQIDWRFLYDELDGFLLFEDLRKQWELQFNPDYVLIDSRTGHTDVGGICTRQFPDSVVIFFFPNSQNLRGLWRIVQDIRDEEAESDKPIDLHFIMSNVPDLDDEDSILEKSINFFRVKLDFGSELLTIHRYDSLSLLNQVVFTRDRPRSRLAREYSSVAERIVHKNLEDAEGALHYLRDIQKRRHIRDFRRTGSISRLQRQRSWYIGVEKQLKKIESSHKQRGDVLFRLGEVRSDNSEFDEAHDLLCRALETGYRTPDLFLKRAVIRQRFLNDRDGSCEDAGEVLRFDHASFYQVRRAIDMLSSVRLQGIANANAIVNLPIEYPFQIAGGFIRSKIEAEISTEIFRRIFSNDQVFSIDNRQK